MVKLIRSDIINNGRYEFYEIENEEISLRLTNVGAAIVSIRLKKRENKNIVLSLASPYDYFLNKSFFGAVVGRNANRIAGGKFNIDDFEYKLEINETNNNNNLHSGSNSFKFRLWDTILGNDRIEFKMESPDMDQGFPGNLNMSVIYELKGKSVVITYKGVSDKNTIFNPTNHVYFNLDEYDGSNDILDTLLMIKSKYYTPVNKCLVPIGEKIDVTGTVFDFTQYKKIGKNIDNDMLQITGGYDHSFLIDTDDVSLFAVAKSEKSKITLKAYTNSNAFQFYSGNFLDEEEICDENNRPFIKRAGFCLETGFIPNSINLETFEKPILEANKENSYTTIYELEY